MNDALSRGVRQRTARLDHRRVRRAPFRHRRRDGLWGIPCRSWPDRRWHSLARSAGTASQTYL